MYFIRHAVVCWSLNIPFVDDDGDFCIDGPRKVPSEGPRRINPVNSMRYEFMAMVAVWAGNVSRKFPENGKSKGNLADSAALPVIESALALCFAWVFPESDAFSTWATGNYQGIRIAALPLFSLGTDPPNELYIFKCVFEL